MLFPPFALFCGSTFNPTPLLGHLQSLHPVMMSLYALVATDAVVTGWLFFCGTQTGLLFRVWSGRKTGRHPNASTQRQHPTPNTNTQTHNNTKHLPCLTTTKSKLVHACFTKDKYASGQQKKQRNTPTTSFVFASPPPPSPRLFPSHHTREHRTKDMSSRRSKYHAQLTLSGMHETHTKLSQNNTHKQDEEDGERSDEGNQSFVASTGMSFPHNKTTPLKTHNRRRRFTQRSAACEQDTVYTFFGRFHVIPPSQRMGMFVYMFFERFHVIPPMSTHRHVCVYVF